jgi:hypothetical protein
MLIEAVEKLGRHWKDIQRHHFVGRSKNCIKNRCVFFLVFLTTILISKATRFLSDVIKIKASCCPFLQIAPSPAHFTTIQTTTTRHTRRVCPMTSNTRIPKFLHQRPSTLGLSTSSNTLTGHRTTHSTSSVLPRAITTFKCRRIPTPLTIRDGIGPRHR